jgi:Ca2+-binding EF-hand superfamily protein
MVRLTQHDVAACREAFAAHDGDAARLRAMMVAVKQPVSDEEVMDMCSQVAVTRPLHAALGESAEGGGGPGGGGGGATGGGGVHGNAAVDASGDSGFDMLLRMVEDRCRGVEDEEEDVRLAFMALGGNADGTGTVSASKMKAVVKVWQSSQHPTLCLPLDRDPGGARGGPRVRAGRVQRQRCVDRPARPLFSAPFPHCLVLDPAN